MHQSWPQLGWISLMVVLVGCTCGQGPAAPDAATEPAARGDLPPNVLILVADDLGIDNVRAYKAHRVVPVTPTIDRLAAEGVRFRNAWSYPECSPARAAMLTGRYGRRYGLGQRVGNVAASQPYAIPDDEVMIPEVLDRAEVPWTTAALGKWHLTNHVTPDWKRDPLDQGFDWFAGSASNLEIASADRTRHTYDRWEKNVNGDVGFVETYATTDTTNDAIARIHAMPEPWFLWVGYQAPHAPFHIPDASLRPSAKDYPDTDSGNYKAMVEALDTEIGRLLDAMPQQVRDNTVIVLVGDNGTPRSAILPPLERARGKSSMYEGGVRVPLIVNGPMIQEGAWVGELVHVVDLMPTVAEIAGVTLDHEVDGQSLMPWLKDPSAAPNRRFVYTERFGHHGPGPYDMDFRAVRDTRYKLLRNVHGFERLFDLRSGRSPLDEGPDLLGDGPLDPKAEAAYEALKVEMDRVTDALVYAHGPHSTRGGAGPQPDTPDQQDP